ncbi:MAG: hypothetical protein EOP94_05245 [Zymomonas sp.]|nr:MAG: hypothetical protein EOP94_05245 [Zymomonas sp.]
MSEQEITGATRGADDPVWSPLDRLVLQATEQGYRGVTVTDDTWAGLATAFDHAQMLELLFTIGTFMMMSWIFNSTGLQIESTPDPN